MYTDSLAIYPYQAALIHTYALAWSSCECGILSSMDFISLSNWSHVLLMVGTWSCSLDASIRSDFSRICRSRSLSVFIILKVVCIVELKQKEVNKKKHEKAFQNFLTDMINRRVTAAASFRGVSERAWWQPLACGILFVWLWCHLDGWRQYSVLEYSLSYSQTWWHKTSRQPDLCSSEMPELCSAKSISPRDWQHTPAGTSMIFQMPIVPF